MLPPRPRFRLLYLLLPVSYALVGAGLLVVHRIAVEWGVGHGPPPAWVYAVARAITMPWELWGLAECGFCFNLCILAGLGYLLDRGVERLSHSR